jgi:DNA segregation ATPase FtsK/SpoIIIE, S-DNA-T family
VPEYALVVQNPADGSAHDVLVDIESTRSVADLTDALRIFLGSKQPGLGLWLVRERRFAATDETVESLRLAQGDVVSLTSTDRDACEDRMSPGGADQAGAFELVIVGGTMAGHRRPLGAGVHSVGRDPLCDVTLADNSASRRHAELRLTTEGVVVADLGSTNGTFVDGKRVTSPHELQAGEVVEIGSTLLEITRHVATTNRGAVGSDGLVRFNRPPRVSRSADPPTIATPTPPDRPRKARLPFASAGVPVLLGVAMFVFAHNPLYLLFCAMGPVMIVTTTVGDRRSGRRDFKQNTSRFDADLERISEQIATTHRQLLADRRARAPHTAELYARASSALPELWERRPTDPDFLLLRVGVADQPSELQIQVGDRGDDGMRARVMDLADRYAIAPLVPAVVSVQDVGVVGMAGPRAARAGLARWIVAQAATLHSPRDLAILVVVGSDDQAGWAWTKWLPHVGVLRGQGSHAASTGAAGATDKALFGNVEELIVSRVDELDGLRQSTSSRFEPSVLVVLGPNLGVSRATLARLLTDGPRVGVTFVCLADRLADLPGECRQLVELASRGDELTVIDTRDGSKIESVIADGIDLDIARDFALALAPLRDVSARDATGSLPARLPLFELLALTEPLTEQISQRWRRRDSSKLEAIIGQLESGPLIVDVRSDGPHALIAGTTGAGKSELLQTLIAALAAAHPPDRISFVLIDYKGGAAFKQCAQFPHTVGFVTDLDEHLAHRALLSLNAELKRREATLRDVGAKDLLEMEGTDPSGAPPSLMIIIDEFATLVKEVPDFVAGIVDIAQRGRSLGVHLVLATQRPAGVINDSIRANTNLRIALRVSDDAESGDVIGVADAARIPRSLPGRGFVRTGHGELRAFQAAYSSAQYATTRAAAPIRVRSFDLGAGEAERATTSGSLTTELFALVEATTHAAHALGITRLSSPWLDPLPYVLPLDRLETSREPDSFSPALGLIDEPERQAQRTWNAPLEAVGHLLVYGGAGSGKTTLLRTLAASAAQVSSPAELHIYGIDAAARGLLAIRALPHCGDVLVVDQVEKIERLFAMLEASIEERKELLSAAGAGSLHERSHAVGRTESPNILVLIDGWSGFRATFEDVDHGAIIDQLERQLADGRAVGVHFAITAERRGAVPMSLAGLIASRVVLRMADPDEYAALGVGNAAKGALLPPGRGFVEQGTEIQIAVVSRDGSGEAQAATLADLAAKLAQNAGATAAPIVRVLPAEVSRADMPRADLTHSRLPLGIESHRLEPAWVDLGDVPHFLIAGPGGTGRTTALQTLVHAYLAGAPDLRAYALVPRRLSALRHDSGWSDLAIGIDACEQLAQSLAEEVRGRDESSDRLLIVVDDGDELADGRVATALELIVRRGRDTQVHVIAAAQTHSVHRAFAGWLAELKKLKHGLLLQPDIDIDGDMFGVRLPRKSSRAFPPGRGYLTRRGSLTLVQVAK